MTVLLEIKEVRRVVSVDEIRPSGPSGFDIANVFAYDYAFDSFSPTTPAEVLDRSYRLNEIAKSFGWSPSRVQASLAGRAAYVAEAVNGGGFSPSALASMVRGYAAKETLRELDRSGGKA